MPSQSPVPRVGMFATVRNRRAIMAGVEPLAGPTADFTACTTIFEAHRLYA